MSKYKDLTGQKFGRLTCIKDAGRSSRKQVLWLCKCDCGKLVIVKSNSLLTGNTKSCGCLAREILIKRNTVHSLSKGKDGKVTRLYRIWRRMKQRCYDKNCSDYKRYGGRGIKVCDEWLDYRNFYDWAMSNNYKNNLTIERINNDGDYEPDNCKWIPPEAQARNKRSNRYITFRGVTKTLAEWSRILGMEHSLLRYRLDKWGTEKAFTTPARRERHEINQSKVV